MSQFPLKLAVCSLSITAHSVEYSVMKSYSHTPLANPATHVHWYAWNEIGASTVDSVHVAPFVHGVLAHSSTSMSQFPLMVAVSALVPCKVAA